MTSRNKGEARLFSQYCDFATVWAIEGWRFVFGRGKIFFLRSPCTGLGTYPASCEVGTGGYFTGGKRSVHPHLRLRIGGALPPHLHMHSWRAKELM
jgi:hypothetical protein